MVAWCTHNALCYRRKARIGKRSRIGDLSLCHICASLAKKRPPLAQGSLPDGPHLVLDSSLRASYDAGVTNRWRFIVPEICPLIWVPKGVTYSSWFVTPVTRALRLGAGI